MPVNNFIIEKAKQYIESTDSDERDALQAELDKVDGCFDEIVAALRPRPQKKVQKGYLENRKFQLKKFAKTHSDKRMTLYVPENYASNKNYGLLIFLHGGGHSVVKEAGAFVFTSYGISDILKESGFIVCCPNAPYNKKSFASWNLPEVDDYLMDVIEEMEHFYKIDPHHIILGGTSMGGMGVNHIAHRMSDRIASFLSSASSWDFAYWPCITGTHFWILQGINDAVMFKRRHGTDIEFARLTKMRLEQAGVSHFYCEHSGRHSISNGRRFVREWVLWCRDVRRNPFYNHVVAVTPRGMTPLFDFKHHKTPMPDIAAAPHCRWVTIEETNNETVSFDMAVTSEVADDSEDDWNNFSLTLKRKNISAGILEAFIRDDKVIEVTPINVKKFTLWLHPDMVDLNDVRILVNGEEVFHGAIKPALGTLLASYCRRRDWGLLYPAKVTIEGDWQVKDQVKLLKNVV